MRKRKQSSCIPKRNWLSEKLRMRLRMMKLKPALTKKGQFWYADFVMGILVIAFIAVLFAKAVVDVPERESNLNIITQDAVTVANLLMSPGVDSANWKNGKGKIGLVRGGKVNYQWYSDFTALVESGSNQQGYQMARQLLGTKYDFAVYFKKKDGSVYGNRAYGGIDDIEQLQALEAENIIRAHRVVYFDGTGDNIGEMYTMVLVVWDYGKEKLTSKRVCENAESLGLCAVLCGVLPDYSQGCQSEWGKCLGVTPPAC